jgi:hypothetical protein
VVIAAIVFAVGIVVFDDGGDAVVDDIISVLGCIRVSTVTVVVKTAVACVTVFTVGGIVIVVVFVPAVLAASVVVVAASISNRSAAIVVGV